MEYLREIIKDANSVLVELNEGSNSRSVIKINIGSKTYNVFESNAKVNSFLKENGFFNLGIVYCTVLKFGTILKSDELTPCNAHLYINKNICSAIIIKNIGSFTVYYTIGNEEYSYTFTKGNFSCDFLNKELYPFFSKKVNLQEREYNIFILDEERLFKNLLEVESRDIEFEVFKSVLKTDEMQNSLSILKREEMKLLLLL